MFADLAQYEPKLNWGRHSFNDGSFTFTYETCLNVTDGNDNNAEACANEVLIARDP